jgi:hypothetical protein
MTATNLGPRGYRNIDVKKTRGVTETFIKPPLPSSDSCVTQHLLPGAVEPDPQPSGTGSSSSSSVKPQKHKPCRDAVVHRGHIIIAQTGLLKEA